MGVRLCTLTAQDQVLTDLILIIGCFVFHAGKRNQDVQVQRPHLHPPESVRTVQESCKPLFPGSAHPTGTSKIYDNLSSGLQWFKKGARSDLIYLFIYFFFSRLFQIFPPCPGTPR